MQIVDGEVVNNHLLKALRPQALKRLSGSLTAGPLIRGQIINHADRPVEQVWFVNRGFVSMVKTMADGRAVEIGGVGAEGLTAPYSVFGLETAIFDAVVQIPGVGFRIRRDVLEAEIKHDFELRRLIESYVQFLIGQIGQTAACNRLHSVEQRCCRWLLTAADSALEDSFSLTHEFLAMMLGAQRSGVSAALQRLKQRQIIDYHRGEVAILNRAAIEAAACECHAQGVEQLQDSLGTLQRGHSRPHARA